MSKHNRWANAWSHSEDALLFEVIELTNNRDRKAWCMLKSLGVDRSYKAFIGRRAYLEAKQNKEIKKSLPKGWGIV